MTDAPRCGVCAAAAIDTPATHRVATDGVRPDHEPDLVCGLHALPGDEPLDGVTDEMLRRAIEIPRLYPRPETGEGD